MRESGVGGTTTERVDEARLAEDLEASPLRGQPLRRRVRNFRPAVDSYVAALGGPLPYMQRIREIEIRVDDHERRLAAAWAELSDACAGDAAAFAARWRGVAAAWRFDEVNDLIERHNRFFPAEARLPMDPRTGDYVLIRGERYEKRPLDATWVLERFPADAERAA